MSQPTFYGTLGNSGSNDKSRLLIDTLLTDNLAAPCHSAAVQEQGKPQDYASACRVGDRWNKFFPARSRDRERRDTLDEA